MPKPKTDPSKAPINPCHLESKLSMECLEKNGYQQDICINYFQNYKNCKEFWYNVKGARTRARIFPRIPDTEEERQAVKKKFKETGKYV